MIPTKIEKRIEQAEKYKVSKVVLDKNTKEVFADLSFSEFENYSLMYSLLEDIEFAIYRQQCTDINEVRDFIKKYKDSYIYPRVDYDLDENAEESI